MLSASEKIQIAADMLDDEFQRLGYFGIGKSQCLAFACRLYAAWEQSQPITDLSPGDIAKRFRERYDGEIPAVILETPLTQTPSDI